MRTLAVALFVLFIGSMLLLARVMPEVMNNAEETTNKLLVWAMLASVCCLVLLSVLIMFFGFTDELKDTLMPGTPEPEFMQLHAPLEDPHFDGLFED